MKYDPVTYKRFERDPIGCFEIHMLANGWGNSKYVNDKKHTLLSVEVSEFIRLVHHIMKECDNWIKLQKFANKNGTKIQSDNYESVMAVTYIGDVMDYAMYIDGPTVTIFPYRKYQH